MGVNDGLVATILSVIGTVIFVYMCLAGGTARFVFALLTAVCAVGAVAAHAAHRSR